MSIAYSECVFASLVMQHAKHMRPIMSQSVACQLYNIFPHYFIKARFSGVGGGGWGSLTIK
jgi:hypothetical protein